MRQTFAQVVDCVKQLSLDEKEELLEFLNGFLIEGAAQNTKSHVVASDFEKEASGKRLRLAELASRMPDDYQVTDEGCGDPVGKEEW